jgi:regulator of protease activity HflC (stomatin/prohibitin superfamily)
MADQLASAPPPPEAAQLTQVRAPLRDASEVFAQVDETGRMALVVVPERPNRLLNELLIAGVVVAVGGLAVGFLMDNWLLALGLLVVAVFLAVQSIWRAVWVAVPEGANALLVQRGRHVGVLPSGLHLISPWIIVSHLVTRREIPFDVPVLEVPTRDNVRARLDTLITFTINDPYRFVYSIASSDFDRVLYSACLDAVRLLVRGVDAERVLDLGPTETDGLRTALSADVEPYGVTITRVNITEALLPAEFMAAEEARQLAIVQRAEQAERQALAVQRLTDEEALARQRVLGRVEREREELRVQIQLAESRRKIAELEAEANQVRLERLEHALQNYPAAAEWEWQSQQLEVSRALAGNTRAVVQIGSAAEITRAFLTRDIMREPQTRTAEAGPGGDAQVDAAVVEGLPAPNA